VQSGNELVIQWSPGASGREDQSSPSTRRSIERLWVVEAEGAPSCIDLSFGRSLLRLGGGDDDALAVGCSGDADADIGPPQFLDASALPFDEFIV